MAIDSADRNHQSPWRPQRWQLPVLGAGAGAILGLCAVLGTAGCSKGGAPDHPGWYKNLLANPEAEVQVGTEKHKVRARTATGAERDQLWVESLKFWPPYADYKVKAGDREIPVVVLDPV